SKENGQYHSNWLNMMYPRLFLAKNLLKQDGVIFISIDDNEVDNLRLMMNEVFGEENFVAQAPRVAKRTSNKGTHFRPTKDYIVAYAKYLSLLPEFGVKKNISESDYSLADENGRKYKQSGASLYQPSLDSRPNQRYYIEAPDGSLIIPPGNVFPDQKKDGAKIVPLNNTDKVWRWSVDSYLKQKDLLIFTKGSSKNPLLDENGKQSKWNIYPKVYFDEDQESTLHPEDVIYNYPNSQGTKELLVLDVPFSFSKPSELIKYLIMITQSDANSTILDFFAGSATTAHAVMQLNTEDGGNRKCISVQLPELTDEKSEAYKAGYKTIADIAKERIRRAGKQIMKNIKYKIEKLEQEIEKLNSQLDLDGKEEKINNLKKEIEKLKNQDLGFKVLKLSDSNFKQWQQIKGNDAEALEKQMKMFVDPVSENATTENMVYELLLKSGKDLNSKLEHKENYYCVNDNELVFMLEKATQEIVEAVIKEKPQKVVALDRLFKDNDQLKTNASLQMKDAEIEFKTI
ncbi:site-specific DNA-methyltransferase, partial [candidate division KSB1 bacterium]|nr:site-specific DNA-methyltransferase [candidate division KSB1 bacterium]